MRQNLALVLPLALLGHACSSSDDDGPVGDVPAPVLVLNQETAAVRAYGSGELRLVAVPEAGQELDLTGDGDLDDHGLVLLDQAWGLMPTGLAMLPDFRRDEVPPIEVNSSAALGVFVVDEARTGSDANGNGTPGEITTWVFDRRIGAVRDLGFLHHSLLLGGELAAFLTSDGVDTVLAVHDARSATTDTFPLPTATLMKIADDRVAFLRAETTEGVDLNLDGDASDPWVLQLYDARTRSLAPPRWAVQGSVHAVGGLFGLAVNEASQGGEDLDGDGEADDDVFVVWDPATGLIDVPDVSTPLLDFIQPDPERFLLMSVERGIDQNGDGDGNDLVVVVHDPRSRRTLHTGLASRWPVVPAGGWLAIQVSEEQQGGVDLDGDGQAVSDVLHVVDAVSGRTSNLGFQGFGVTGLDGHVLAMRAESDTDWNGDGDRSDFVLFHWDARARRLFNTRLACGGTLGTSGTRALVVVPEEMQGADRNGDGDIQDAVLATYDVRTRTATNHGLAIGARDTYLGPEGFGAALVPESQQGTDLNGDGDMLDEVLYSIEVR